MFPHKLIGRGGHIEGRKLEPGGNDISSVAVIAVPAGEPQLEPR